MAQTAKPNEIVHSRILDAPRERVWEAFTNSQQLDAWWGPKGFKNVTKEFEIRNGGIWRHTMIGPDGTEYPNLTKFEEVVKPERITYTNGGGKKGGKGANFRATWTLEARGEKTEITGRLIFDTSEERDFVVKEYGAIEGGKQTMERLAELLSKKPPQK